MNISNNFRNGYMNTYSARNAAKKDSQPVSNPTVENKPVSFGSRSPLIDLVILDTVARSYSDGLRGSSYRPKSKPSNTDTKSTDTKSISEYRPYQDLAKYKQMASDNDIAIKNIKRDTCFGPALVDVEVDGKDYKLYTFARDELDAYKKATYANESYIGRRNSSWHYDADKLEVQIRNIKDQHRGRFVQEGNKDVFIPFVLGEKPDVSKDINVLKYGNAEFPQDRGGIYKDNAVESIEKALGKSVSPDDVKVIEYVEKMGERPFPGEPAKENDNIERKYAFGYYDKTTETGCLYFENKGDKTQIVKQDEAGNIETIDLD